jgi:ATP-binding cassette subfamily F protein uup
VDKAQNLFVKELEWMRRQPKAAQSKSREDFYEIKDKAQSRRRKKWN